MATGPDIRERIRLLAMLLALTAGSLHIADLWIITLSRDSLQEAGRGVLFILLALGLMGTRRLSLVLTAMLCLTALPSLVAVEHPVSLADWIEVATLVIVVGLLLSYPDKTPQAEDAL